tara:strand:+ start:26391 stop:27071 length:681 start_codon:yes stop_codon:yes gene_type:complete
MNKFIIATWGEWNIFNYNKYFSANPDFTLITDKEDLTLENLKEINPKYIFFPHWSHIIKEEVFSNFNCVVFHMTDLPFGRGGSPLQNLIVRDIKNTKISALKVEAGIDTGPIYLKSDLSLEGSALEIFERFSKVVYSEMIPKFISSDLEPTPQSGEATVFKRRKKEDGSLENASSLKEAFDYIRMLDAPGYPNAYLEHEKLAFEFKNAKFDGSNLTATVTIKERDE